MNGNYVYVKTSQLGLDELKSSVLKVFHECEVEHGDDDYYSKPNATIYVSGPRATKEHRWQVSVLSPSDEEAMDDLGSYLNIELEQYVKELPDQDNSVMVHVVREAGTYGHVIVAWRMSGEHNGVYDISPVEGIVSYI